MHSKPLTHWDGSERRVSHAELMVTLGDINNRLENLENHVKDICKSVKGTKGKPSMDIRLDRLERIAFLFRWGVVLALGQGLLIIGYLVKFWATGVAGN